MRSFLLVLTVLFSISASAAVDYFESSTVFESSSNLRDKRKVGLGVAAGGELGVAGLMLELNFEDINAAHVGFGTGPGYNTVALSWKHSFNSDYVGPYVRGGYSRWYNSSGTTDRYRQSNVLDMVLTDREKDERRFAADFVTGALGAQYYQLSGELAGASFFAEVSLMVEPFKRKLVPNGSVGALYFF